MKGYLRLSRTITYSVASVLPLLVAYEIGALYLAREGGSGLRNGADVLLRTLLAAGGLGGTLAFTGVLVVAGLALAFMERRRRAVPLRPPVLAGMVMESAVYALLLGTVVGTATAYLLGGMGVRLAADGAGMMTLPLADAIVLSIGAGVYEELLFRVLLVGGLFALLNSSGLERKRSGIAAALIAALLFSAFHYVGPYGDPWEIPSFTFRFLAGLTFSGLFLLRGFGIAVWTHALYDIFLFVGRAL
jgi:hypothetical protein